MLEHFSFFLKKEISAIFGLQPKESLHLFMTPGGDNPFLQRRNEPVGYFTRRIERGMLIHN